MAKSEGSIHLKYSDRISSLPEPLLSHILSLLPTNNAVATSLLSKRWKFLWTCITNLIFDDGHGQPPNTCSEEALNMKRMKFTQFVNRVLVLVNPPYIQNFHLKCHHQLCDPFYIDLWICAAIERTVQKLELHLVLAQPMELPLNYFYSNTLAVVKLNCDIHFNIAASPSICFPNLLTLHLSKITFTIATNCSVSFPSLKDLLLDSVKYANEDSVHKLFASCPVLDTLVINRSFWDNVGCLIISIPTLTSLKTYYKCSQYSGAYKLRTPALKYLYLEDHSKCDYFIVEDLSCLLEARIEYKRSLILYLPLIKKKQENIFKFIGGLFNVKFLSISGHILKLIGSRSEHFAPVFRNLTRLELGRHSCRDWSAVIKKLLESTDNLEHLVMKGSSCGGSHESWWTGPLSVPMCLLQRVTTISFTAIGDCSDELELVAYFLKNAEVLELLTVTSFGGSEAKLKLMQKISMIPRGSRACQVAFKWITGQVA